MSSPRETPEEGLEGGEAQRSLVPPRQPLVVGALAVMLLASSINEVKLGIPAVSIRLGLQVGPITVTPHPYASPSAMGAAVPAMASHDARTGTNKSSLCMQSQPCCDTWSASSCIRPAEMGCSQGPGQMPTRRQRSADACLAVLMLMRF